MRFFHAFSNNFGVTFSHENTKTQVSLITSWHHHEGAVENLSSHMIRYLIFKTYLHSICFQTSPVVFIQAWYHQVIVTVALQSYGMTVPFHIPVQ